MSSAPDEKSFASGSSPILACSTFTSTAGSGTRASAPNTSAAFSSSRARHCDQVRANAKMRRQLGQRLLALPGSQRHPRLERRAAVPAWALAHRASCSHPFRLHSGRRSTHPAAQIPQATSMSAAMMMSHAIATSQPSPRHAPFTTATTSFKQIRTFDQTSLGTRACPGRLRIAGRARFDAPLQERSFAPTKRHSAASGP